MPSKAAPPIRVPLADGSAEVVLSRRDFDILCGAGIPFPWFMMGAPLGAPHVRCYHPASAAGPGHTLSIARLLMEAPPGKAVRHRDGDPLNLQRRNLFLAPDQRAKGRERAVWRRLCKRAA